MICPNCRRETAATLFCHGCDVYLMNPSVGFKAGLTRRWFAQFWDGITIFAVFLVIFFISASAGASGSAPGRPELGLGNFFITFFWASLGYLAFACWFMSKGKTPGKWLVGIRAVDKSNGDLPGLGRMLVREFPGKWISQFFLGLGYFWAIFDKDNQAWHDKIAGTVVVRTVPGMAVQPYRRSPMVQAALPGASTMSRAYTPQTAQNLTPRSALPPELSSAMPRTKASYCGECGAAVEIGSKFCGDCGAALS